MKYEDFISSTEYQREYDEIIPLGFDCDMCFAVKQLFLRKNSYPLDWGRVVEPKDLIGFRRKMEFLYTEFKDFINEDDLYILDYNRENAKENNMRVINKFNGMHFFHDFPNDKTIAELYPSVKEKYDRRIKRLIDLINSGKKICFCFYMSFDEIPRAEIIYGVETFKKTYPNANADFLILQNDLNIGDDVLYQELSDQVRRIVFGDGLADNKIALKSATFKLKQLLNALVVLVNKKTSFKASELSSKYHDGDVITNPTSDFRGMISYGPYAPLNSGNHSVTVDYELTNNYCAFVDVVSDKGKVVMPKTELPHNRDKFKFDFTLDKLVFDLEVRFYCAPTEQIDENNKFKLFGIHID